MAAFLYNKTSISSLEDLVSASISLISINLQPMCEKFNSLEIGNVESPQAKLKELIQRFNLP